MISRLVVQNPDDSVEIATRSSHLANLREYDNLEIQRTQALQDLNQLDAQQILYQEAFDEIENLDETDLSMSPEVFISLQFFHFMNFQSCSCFRIYLSRIF